MTAHMMANALKVLTSTNLETEVKITCDEKIWGNGVIGNQDLQGFDWPKMVIGDLTSTVPLT